MTFIKAALVWILCTCLPLVASYSSGAPDLACPGIAPIHTRFGDITSQPMPPPYNIELSSYNYTGGQNITVRITGIDGHKIGGFLLQARRADWRLNTNELIGEFTVISNETKLTCSRDDFRGLTHTSGYTLKDSVETIWTAPENSTGHLYIYGAVAYNYTTFWGKHAYALIEDPTAGPLPTGQPPTVEGPDVTTAEPVPEFDTSTCGRNKGCYRDPPGCSASQCTYLVTWQREGDYFRFELESAYEGWVAVGFSDTPSMLNTSVTDCVYDDNTYAVKVEMSYNLPTVRSNEVLPNPQEGLDPGSLVAGTSGNRIRCSFRRMRVLPNTNTVVAQRDARIFDLDRPYYILVGKGPATSGMKRIHPTRPIISAAKVNLELNTDVTGSQKSPVMVKAHACLMCIAWILCASVGLIIARFYKPMWPSIKPFGLQLWFVIHRIVMVLAACLTIAGFIIIFVHVRGYSNIPNYPGKAHPPLGICVTALVIINPIMAMFRPDKDSPKRPIFNWAHRIVGVSAFGLSFGTMSTGLRLPAANLPLWPLWLMIATAAFHVLFSILLEIYENHANKTQDVMTINSEKGEKAPPGETGKLAILCVYVPVMLGSAVATVVAIAIH